MMSAHRLRILLLALSIALLPGVCLAVAPAAAQEPAPAGANGLTGTLTVRQGWLTIVYGDVSAANRPEPRAEYGLVDDAGRRTQLLIDGGAEVPATGLQGLNRRRAIVTGYLVDETTMRVASIRAAGEAGALAPDTIGGSQPWVTLLCRFADLPAEPKPSSYFRDLFSGSFPGLDHYWRQTSRDRITLAGSAVYGWYGLPRPRVGYVGDLDGDGQQELDFDRAAVDCASAANRDVFFPQFVGVNLMFNGELDGYSWGGSHFLTLDGEAKLYRVTWMPPWGYANQAVVAHEMGHGFGLSHSVGASGNAYDNPWDVMSDTWTNCALSRDPVFGCLAQQPSAVHLSTLGWLEADEMLDASSAEGLLVEPVNRQGQGGHVLVRVPVPGVAGRYFAIEARQRQGYDAALPGEGVVIHEIDVTGADMPRLLAANASCTSGDEGEAWTVGETFSDCERGAAISIISVGDAGYAIDIQALPAPAPRRPAADAAQAPGRVDFSWSTVPGKGLYELQIDSSAAFDSPDRRSLEVAGATSSQTLPAGRYYWRVRTLPEGSFSTVRRLAVGAKETRIGVGSLESHPALVQLGDGTLAAFYASTDPAGSHGLWLSRSHDSGRQWLAPLALPLSNGDARSPAATILQDGALLLVWSARTAGTGDVWLSRSGDGGLTWSEPSNLTPGFGESDEPAVFQDREGTVWVAWSAVREGERHVWYRTSAGAGEAWSSIQQLSAVAGAANVALGQTGDGRLTAVWEREDRLWVRAKPAGQPAWGEEEPLLAGCCYRQPALATTADGTTWLAAVGGDGDIWVDRVQNLPDSRFESGRWTTFAGGDSRPSLVALANGRLGVAWESQRAGGETTTVWYGEEGVHADINPPPYLANLRTIPARPLPGQVVDLTVTAADERKPLEIELVWTLDGAAQPTLSLQDDGLHNDGVAGDGVYGARLGAFREGSALAYQVMATAADGSRSSAPASGARTLEISDSFSRTADVLLVLDSGSADSSWFSPYYTASLDASGTAHDIWETGVRGEITEAVLAQYFDGVVVWAVPYSGYLTQGGASLDALRSYLDAGGRLFLTGQDIAYHLRSDPFLADYLHVRFVQDDLDLPGLVGAAGDAIGDGLRFGLGAGDGAQDQPWTDEIDPLGPAISLLTYVSGGAGGAPERSGEPAAVSADFGDALGEPGPQRQAEAVERERKGLSLDRGAATASGTAGVRVDTGRYRLVFLAFGFEGINRATDRQLLMQRITEWLSDPASHGRPLPDQRVDGQSGWHVIYLPVAPASPAEK